MSHILLPFARHAPSGRIVGPDEVAQGRACNCVCLFCGVPVQARRGTVNREHFAHEPRAVDEDHHCSASFARCLFWMARRILAESEEITTPDYVLELPIPGQPGRFERAQITRRRRVRYESIEFPEKSGTQQTDLAVVSAGGYPLHLVLSYGWSLPHPPSTDPEIAQLHIAMDGLKLRYAQTRSGFRAAMARYLLQSTDNKTWLFHPRERPLRERLSPARPARKARRKDRHPPDTPAPGANGGTEPGAAGPAVAGSNDAPGPTRPEAVLVTQPAHGIARLPDLSIKQRIQELVEIVHALRASGVESGFLCQQCKVMHAAPSEACPHCGSRNFVETSLSDEYVRHLDKKYFCWNYGLASLHAVPHLTPT